MSASTASLTGFKRGLLGREQLYGMEAEKCPGSCLPGHSSFFGCNLAAIQLGRNMVQFGEVQRCSTVHRSCGHVHALDEGRLELGHLVLGADSDAYIVRHRCPCAS